MRVHFSLVVMWPDEVDEGAEVSLLGSHMSVISEGIPTDMQTVLLLSVAEGIEAGLIREGLEEEAPMANGDVLAALAAHAARLNLIHTMMHLPLQSSPWTHSTM